MFTGAVYESVRLLARRKQKKSRACELNQSVKQYGLTCLYTDSAGLDMMYVAYSPDMHPCVCSP